MPKKRLVAIKRQVLVKLFNMYYLVVLATLNPMCKSQRSGKK